MPFREKGGEGGQIPARAFKGFGCALGQIDAMIQGLGIGLQDMGAGEQPHAYGAGQGKEKDTENRQKDRTGLQDLLSGPASCTIKA